jgi:hypothetical protein
MPPSEKVNFTSILGRSGGIFPPETGIQSDFHTQPHHMDDDVLESWNLRIGALKDSNFGSWEGLMGRYTI